GDLAGFGCSRPTAFVVDTGGTSKQRAPAVAGAFRARCGAALHEPVDAEHVDRFELLPARLVHDEIQSKAERASGIASGVCGTSSLSGREHAPGLAVDPIRTPANPG